MATPDALIADAKWIASALVESKLWKKAGFSSEDIRLEINLLGDGTMVVMGGSNLFAYRGFPGCCGAAIVHGFDPYVSHLTAQAAAATLTDWIVRVCGPTLHVAILRQDGQSHWIEALKQYGWTEVLNFVNGYSGHSLAMLKYERRP